MTYVQVLREAQTRAQQAPPPPGSSAPQKDNGLGPPGAAARKEFEVTPLPNSFTLAVCIWFKTHAQCAHYRCQKP